MGKIDTRVVVAWQIQHRLGEAEPIPKMVGRDRRLSSAPPRQQRLHLPLVKLLTIAVAHDVVEFWRSAAKKPMNKIWFTSSDAHSAKSGPANHEPDTRQRYFDGGQQPEQVCA